ncbi:O-methyltransferase [Mycobacterium sp. AZCC_0083]|uniref:O-methyltransferase n=1 Tax=Mycobacterium sp. AZCC_0083 TaxID=2735882 RepID=UPI00160B464D|nr:O-methyltransferase [Mycobacterium sp. AZCC_0083]MBB5165506.1 catechol O-methyltransferase [Mycobacterium sp. AZCC_0083]
MSRNRTLRQKLPFLRYSFVRGALGGLSVLRTGQMGDGREDAMAEYVIANAPAGDVDAAIDAIDEFAYDKSILMNVGDEKGQLLDAAVKRANPELAMELGAYCGYSGLRIARAAPAAKVFSIEKSGANASVARRVWEHAGLADRVTCINGTVDDATTVEVLAKDYGFTDGCLDFVFLDHWKDVYLADLQRLVSQGWLHPGTIVVADNVGIPGAPKYRAYMKEQQGKQWQTIEHETHVEYQTLLKDLVLESEFLG